jgi:hypothetical protein
MQNQRSDKDMRIQNKIFKILILSILALPISGCIHVEIKGAGVFKEPVKHVGRWYNAEINIPKGIYGEEIKFFNADGSYAHTFDPGDGSKVGFTHLGSCGAQLSFTGIMIPVIPFFLPNFCKSNGFWVNNKDYLDLLGVTLQLRYNATTYDPYIDNGSVKFKISNFSSFKKAPDKTLIIHKRKADGTIFTKELPFDWKIVVETSGGL